MIVFYLSILFDKSRLKSNSNTKSRSKSIITRNFVIDFYRFPIFVEFSDFRILSTTIHFYRLSELSTCYVLVMIKRGGEELTDNSTAFLNFSIHMTSDTLTNISLQFFARQVIIIRGLPEVSATALTCFSCCHVWLQFPDRVILSCYAYAK